MIIKTDKGGVKGKGKWRIKQMEVCAISINKIFLIKYIVMLPTHPEDRGTAPLLD